MIPVIIKFCRKHKLYDLPDTRKLHNTMIPRLGGIAFLPSMLFAFIMSLLVLSHVLGGMEVTIGLWSCVFIVSIFIIYSVGVIDADYKDQILICYRNTGDEPFFIKRGDRIAQGVFVKFLKTDDDNASGERNGGVGSTGV